MASRVIGTGTAHRREPAIENPDDFSGGDQCCRPGQMITAINPHLTDDYTSLSTFVESVPDTSLEPSTARRSRALAPPPARCGTPDRSRHAIYIRFLWIRSY